MGRVSGGDRGRGLGLVVALDRPERRDRLVRRPGGGRLTAQGEAVDTARLRVIGIVFEPVFQFIEARAMGRWVEVFLRLNMAHQHGVLKLLDAFRRGAQIAGFLERENTLIESPIAVREDARQVRLMVDRVATRRHRRTAKHAPGRHRRRTRARHQESRKKSPDRPRNRALGKGEGSPQ